MPPRRSRLAYYGQLSQVGIEMAAPIAVGAVIDRWRDVNFPVFSIVGAVIGLVGGLIHLVRLANREDQVEDDPPERSP
jgi:F0F1-type ATP synthase assembly protein I